MSKTKKIISMFFSSILSLLLIVVIAVGSYIGLINSNIAANASLFSNGSGTTLVDWNNGEVPDTLPDDFYMLLLGVDSNTARTTGIETDDYAGVFRSDTIILAHINLTEQKISLCSFARDIMTEFEGYSGTYKLNAAYALGGVEQMRIEIESMTGVEIPYYTVIDMDGFVQIIDSLGGLEVDVEYAFYDPELEAGIDTAGVQTLDGQASLLYARARYAWEAMGLYPGDDYRQKHQRQIIAAFADKFSESNLLTIFNAVKIVFEHISTNLGVIQMFELASKLNGITSDSIYSMSTPTESYYSDDGVWYEILQEDKWAEVLELFITNTAVTTVDADTIVVLEDEETSDNADGNTTIDSNVLDETA